MPSANPFPNLTVKTTSGLSFAWAEYNGPGAVGSFDASLGPDGVSYSMVMLIEWSDLETALPELLGYSWRDTSTMTPNGSYWMRRNLPWQHPYFNHLFVKRITKVQGIRPEGTSIIDPEDTFNPTEGGVGSGYTINTGPWSEFRLALLTLQFWRPPYFVRTDSDILDDNGNPREWLRYLDKKWELSSQMLSRENAHMIFAPRQGGPSAGNNIRFAGTVGQVVSHLKVIRKWYQIPEAALFQPLVDRTPNGLPANMVYTQTPTVNPVTGYTYPIGRFLPGTVNAPMGGGIAQLTPPYILDTDPTKRFLGCRMGTLRFSGVRFEERELQLPPYLMQIPPFGLTEAISQLQYDVVFEFDLFDPATGDSVPDEFRGHNAMPWAGNGLWYAAITQNGADGVNPPSFPGNPALTPFHYSDFTDLFRIL